MKIINLDFFYLSQIERSFTFYPILCHTFFSSIKNYTFSLFIVNRIVVEEILILIEFSLNIFQFKSRFPWFYRFNSITIFIGLVKLSKMERDLFKAVVSIQLRSKDFARIFTTLIQNLGNICYRYVETTNFRAREITTFCRIE